MTDNRFPWLFKVQDAPNVHPIDRARLGRIADSIAARVGCRVLYNARTGELFFYYGREPQAGALAVPAIGRGYALLHIDVDETVRTLNLGKVSRFVKDRWQKQWKQRDEWNKQEAINSHMNNTRHERLDRARRRLSGRVVVSAGCPVPTARSNRKEN